MEPFRQYAKTVFSAFGNRIKHWTTMNEPQTFCFVGYSAGAHAPGIQDQVGIFCIRPPLHSLVIFEELHRRQLIRIQVQTWLQMRTLF